MTQSIIPIEELRRLAQQHATAVVEAEANGGNGTLLNGELLREFQSARQPFLSDKQYTALYRTYTNMVITAVKNHYAPGSAVESPPVQVSSIKDGDEIYRPNAVAMKPAQWDAYIREVTAMAERFAHEVTLLTLHGGDTRARMKEQQLEAAKFEIDHGLNEEESRRATVIYKNAYVKALEREVNELKGKS